MTTSSKDFLLDRLENQLIFADAQAAEVTKQQVEKMKKAGLKNDN
jgi:hypothetical protein